MRTLDTTSNFIEFNKEVKASYGEFYSKQVDIFFERAMIQERKGLYLSAIEDCKFALALNEFAIEPINKHYIIGYISQLYCDLGQIDKAMYYYQLGLDVLDTSDLNFENDLNLYTNLRTHLDIKNWKVA